MPVRPSPEHPHDQAHRQVERFIRRFDESYRQLAYYAALPLVLTPELLHYLRNQFLREAQIPWVAEADLLLSDLCYPVGYEQYAMDTDVRAYLVAAMQQDLGLECMTSVAKLLLRYVQHLEQMNPYLNRQDLQAQQWAAMVYIDDRQREAVARQVAEAYQSNSEPSVGHGLKSLNTAEMARLSRLVEELAPQLVSHTQLVDYARLVGQLLTNPELASVEALQQTYTVAGVALEVPQALVPESVQDPVMTEDSFPRLQNITFTRAQLCDPSDPGFPPVIQTETGPVATLVRQSAPTRPALEFTIATVVRRNGRWEIERQAGSTSSYYRESLPQDQHLEMIGIPGGTFLMGSPSAEKGRYDRESPQHEVTVAPFFLGRYPVTQAQWRAVAQLPQQDRRLDPDPSSFKGALRPVERVSWYEAIEFCARLSVHTGREYRLPSESEWEYACRAGTTTPFHFGAMITPELANYDHSLAYGDGPTGSESSETTPVDHFGIANAFGVSDMHGNVYEWCQDHWHDIYTGASTDGSAWLTDDESAARVRRGGSWFINPGFCRSAYRLNIDPDAQLTYLGFRVAFSAPRT